MVKSFFLIIFFIFFSQNFLFATDPGNYLAGKYALSQKNNSAAINYFEKIINLNDLDKDYQLDIAQKLCNLYLIEGQIINCLTIAKKIRQKLSYDTVESTNILLALITDDIKKNNLKSALKKIKKIKKTSYERFSIPIIHAWLIAVENKNFKKAEITLNELEKDFVISGLRYLNLALISEYFNKNDKALNLYEKSLSAFSEPSFRLIQLSANAFERKGEFEKAKSLYLKFAEESKDDLIVENELKRIEKKIVPNKLINNLEDAISELYTTIASTFRSDFTYDFSIIYSNLSLFLKNDFEVGQLYLAELLENQEKLVEANNIYKKISPSSNFFWHSKLKTARNIELLGESDKSILLLKQMSNEKKDRYDSLKLLGDIYRNNEKYKDAIKFYDQAILRIKEIEKHHWELLYSRGISLERDKQWELAEKDLVQVLKLVPNQPDVLNYLGYSWIEQRINLEKAKNYIIKAVNLKPRDPYIVDSLGWAYFRLNDYNKAVEELERAVSIKPTDPIINDHLGDAYYKVERKLEALYQWKKAIEFKPNKELEKKIQDKIKKYEENKLDFL